MENSENEELKEQDIQNEEINNVGDTLQGNPKNEEDTNKIQAELEETTDRLKRLMAEFDNFKKRSAKEREGLYSSILSDIVSNLLPVVDNLENAVNVETQDEGYKQGVELVSKQFKDVLTSLGVKEIEGVGTAFNPEYHEAVSSVQDENLGEKEIKEVYRKGYKIGDRVIRHAMVVVAN